MKSISKHGLPARKLPSAMFFVLWCVVNQQYLLLQYSRRALEFPPSQLIFQDQTNHSLNYQGPFWIDSITGLQVGVPNGFAGH
jgi:hypothetical protein